MLFFMHVSSIAFRLGSQDSTIELVMFVSVDRWRGVSDIARVLGISVCFCATFSSSKDMSLK